MKKLMMILGLTLTTQLYCPPAPKVEGAHDEIISHTDITQDANKATANAEHMAENTQSKAPDVPTTSPTSAPKTSGSTASGSVHLDEPVDAPVESAQPASTGELFAEDSAPTSSNELFSAEPTPTVTTIDHPVEKGGWLTPTKKSSTIITDHGDGTHSITNKEEVQSWFSNKTKSTTDIYNSADISTELSTKLKDSKITKENIQDIQKNLTAREKITDKGTKIYNKDDSSIEESTDSSGNKIKTIYRKDGTKDKESTSFTFKDDDGTIKNGQIITIYKADGKIESENTYYSKGSKTELKDSVNAPKQSYWGSFSPFA